MANPQHIAWLREGPASWNARRRQAPFDPDLSSVDLSRELGGHERDDVRQISVHLGDVNLSGANLTDSTLRDTDLTGAALLRTDFTGATLTGSDLSRSMSADTRFRGAILHSTKFVGARFFVSNFSHAQLVGADLHDAMFFRCTFDGTHLYSADLTGAKFILSRPWTARQYFPSSQDSVDSKSFQSEAVRGINDLLDRCREFKTAYGEEPTLYFRGEGRWSWPLRPSVMRASESGEHTFRPGEAEMLNALMTRQPDAFSGMRSALAQWVFARHHGLRTRLLDITRNPLVALFNACIDDEPEDGKLDVFAVPKSLIKPFNSDTIRIILNFAKLPRTEQNALLGKTAADALGDVFPDGLENYLRANEVFSKAVARLYALIRQETGYFEKKIDLRDFFRVFVVEPQRVFERLKAQSGAFLVSAFHERFERDEVLKWTAEVPIYAHHVLRVPRERKASILDDLRLLNLTREVLFPSVDQAALAVTQEREARASKS